MATPTGPLFPLALPTDGRPNASQTGSGTALAIVDRFQTLVQQGGTPTPPAASGGMNIRI